MCDVAYARLVEEYEGDGRAAIAAGGLEPPAIGFVGLVDQVLNEDPPTKSESNVSPMVRDLREALGVA